MNLMTTLRTNITCLLFCLLAAPTAFGQSTYSLNVVGYYNTTLCAGQNLIANQLGTGNDTLNNVLTYGIADGSTLTKWDPVGRGFLPPSVFNAATTNWSVNYSLTYGEGALLTSPVQATALFVGEVFRGFNVDTGVLDWHPNYAAGLYLISSPVPLELPIDRMFAAVTGRDPYDGEWVRILDPATQAYTTTTFDAVSGTWDNGDPVLGVGVAAWFNLIPEPSTFVLAGLGIAALVICRRRA